jgi:hypothetical protein
VNDSTHTQVSPRTWLFAQAAFLAALGIWPTLFGWSLLHSAAAAFCLLAFVWLPGRALIAWTLRSESALERAFLSWTGGLALLGLGFVLSVVLGLRGAIWILPLASLPALKLAGRARPEAPARLPSARELGLLALVLAMALARTRLEFADEWFLGFGFDNGFHSANAAELRWHWPMQDPRLAGVPLRYHFLSYAAPDVLARIFSLPVRECVQGLMPHLAPVCFALGGFTVARVFGARDWLACLVGLGLVAHVDPGNEILRWTNVNWTMRAPFEVGLNGSTSTSSGLCALLALVLLLRRTLQRTTAGPQFLLVLIGLAVSATKASVLPPLIGGLGLAWLWKLVRGRGFDRPLALATATLVAVALPMTLWLVIDKSGYAQSLFAWAPGFEQRTSPFELRVAELVGAAPESPPAWLTLLLLPAYVLAFFGAGGMAFVGWLIVRGEGERDGRLEPTLAFTVLAGMLPTWLLAAPGSSQGFFGYDSLVCAAVLGALGMQRCLAATGWLPRALLWLFCATVALHTPTAIVARIYRPTLGLERSGAIDEYRAGVDWMRANLPSDAVLLANERRLCLGMWSERRMFYDTNKFAPLFHATKRVGAEQPAEVPYADRERAQQALFDNPSAETLAEVRKLLRAPAPLYAVRSRASLELYQHAFHVNVPDLGGADALETTLGAKPVFQNRALAVYKLE